MENFLKEKGKETDSQAKMNEKMLQAEQDERVKKNLIRIIIIKK